MAVDCKHHTLVYYVILLLLLLQAVCLGASAITPWAFVVMGSLQLLLDVAEKGIEMLAPSIAENTILR